MQIKKVLAVVMSLCLAAGAVSYGAPVISQSITAQADAAVEADCYSFDAATGVLTLKGEIDRDALLSFNKNNKRYVTSVIAEEGTVFRKTVPLCLPVITIVLLWIFQMLIQARQQI